MAHAALDAILAGQGAALASRVRVTHSIYDGGRAKFYVSIDGTIYGPMWQAMVDDLRDGWLPEELCLEPCEDPSEVEEQEAEDAREAAAIRAHNRLYGPEI